jgi:WD40 repeat protein
MSVAFSRRGTLIASSSCDKTVRVWDARSGASILPPLRGHDGGVWCVAFSPDGACIASGSFDIRLWDVTTGAETTPPLCGHASAVLSLAFSPDGERLVSSSYDSTIRTWNIKMGIECLAPITGHAGAVRSVAFSSDGKRLLSGSDDKSIILWDASTGAMIQRLGSKADIARHLSIYNVPRQVWEEKWMRFHGLGLQQPGKTNKLADDMSHKAPVRSVNFSPDGNCLVSGSDDGSIMLWDASPGKEAKNLSRPGIFSPNHSVACGGQKHATWKALHSDGVRSVAFSPDGCHIASASADSSVVIWNPDSRTISTALQGHGDVVTSVAFSPDGSRLASGSLDNTIRVWDVNLSVVDIQKHHTYQILSLEFSPDGTRLVSGSSDGKVNVWDTHSGQPTFLPIPVSDKPVYQVAFSPDGTRIVSCSPTDPAQAASYGRTASSDLHDPGADIRVWDVFTGNPLSASYGRTASSDLHDPGDDIRVWDVVTGNPLSAMRRLRQSGALPVTFSTNGKRIHSSIPDDFTYMSQRRDINNVYYASDMLRLKRSGALARTCSHNILSRSKDENYSGILDASRFVDYIPPSPSTIWDVASGDTMSEESVLSKEPRYCPEQTMTLLREWIVDLRTNKVISKVPSSIHVSSFTSWCRLFAIGTTDGQILILHCPLGEGDVATFT